MRLDPRNFFLLSFQKIMHWILLYTCALAFAIPFIDKESSLLSGFKWFSQIFSIRKPLSTIMLTFCYSAHYVQKCLSEAHSNIEYLCIWYDQQVKYQPHIRWLGYLYEVSMLKFDILCILTFTVANYVQSKIMWILLYFEKH